MSADMATAFSYIRDKLFCENTCLIYDQVITGREGDFPNEAQILAGFPNPSGYSTGMEDGAQLAIIMQLVPGREATEKVWRSLGMPSGRSTCPGMDVICICFSWTDITGAYGVIKEILLRPLDIWLYKLDTVAGRLGTINMR